MDTLKRVVDEAKEAVGDGKGWEGGRVALGEWRRMRKRDREVEEDGGLRWRDGNERERYVCCPGSANSLDKNLSCSVYTYPVYYYIYMGAYLFFTLLNTGQQLIIPEERSVLVLVAGCVIRTRQR